ncbi:hypothetical protein [Moraxella canis]|nr:hypothetical protein [Moraxella canis]
MSDVTTIETDGESVQVQLMSREEANLISNFISQVGVWMANHGEKANHIEIVYYPEDDGFEVTNNEENNGLLRRNRVSVFRGELIAWASQQTQQLKGWDGLRKITAFAVVYRDGEFGVLCKTADTQMTETV